MNTVERNRFSVPMKRKVAEAVTDVQLSEVYPMMSGTSGTFLPFRGGTKRTVPLFREVLCMNVEFYADRKKIEGIGKAREMLKRMCVEIGLPESASARNRWLLALHERGAPGAHIPPRPVVGPALAKAETQNAIQDGLMSACEAAATGDPDSVQAGFEQAGQAGVDGIHGYIDSGIEPGNAPLTIHGGWIRNFVSKRPVKVEGKGFEKPMYRTGELYGAFSFTIKKRG